MSRIVRSRRLRNRTGSALAAQFGNLVADQFRRRTETHSLKILW